MAFKREVIFTEDDVTQEKELVDRILKEEDWGSSSSSNMLRNKVNIFDWGEKDETIASEAIASFGRNMMGIDAHDFQEATEFLRTSMSHEDYQSHLSDGSPDISMGIDYTVNAAMPISSMEKHDLLNKFQKPYVKEISKQREKALSAHDVIKCIVLGKPYSLESFRSLKEKMKLLESAIATHDGNTITAVLIFLKKTLKSTILTRQLRKWPQAIDHFIRLLEKTGEWKALIDIYVQLLLKKEALIVSYRQMLKIDNPIIKVKEMKKIYSEYRNADNSHEVLSYIKEQLCLLEMQLVIEESSKRIQNEGKMTSMHLKPTTTSIVQKSLVTTIYYCAMYHFDEVSAKHHPLRLKQEFKVNEKQYEWTVVRARAKLHRWNDISKILTSTNWLKKKTARSYIGFDKVASVLHTSSAPVDVVENYVRLIDDLYSRLKMATNCNCHDAAIDTILAMRDRNELENYRQRVVYDERLRSRITNHLADPHLKWK